jgi:DNA-binding LacI/PurR family transcriptional regulator
VLQAAQQLNYHPNAMARSLILSRSDTLGMVYLHGHSPIHTSASFVRMLDGVLTAGTQLRQNILMCTSYSWSDGMENQSVLLDRRCDGLILVVPPLDNQAIPTLKERGVPFVVFCGQVDDPEVSTVDSANVRASGEMMDALFALGHRRVAFVHNSGELNFSYCVERRAAYCLAYDRWNLHRDPSLEVRFENEESILALLKRPAPFRPTAIFGVSDGLAIEVMTVAQRAGFRVPVDLSIVGYDGIDQATMTQPPLSTVHQPFMEIGARCIEILLDQIVNRTPPGQKELLPARFVARESIGPPPLSVS